MDEYINIYISVAQLQVFTDQYFIHEYPVMVEPSIHFSLLKRLLSAKKFIHNIIKS